jgi:hypothetical protein
MGELFEVRFKTRFLKHFSIQTFIRSVERQPRYEYAFINQVDNAVTLYSNHFSLVETGLNFKFKFREKFFFTGQSLISKGSKWPTFTFQYIKAHTGFLNGNWDLTKYKIQFDHQISIRHFGKTLFHVNYTSANRNAPYFYLIHPISTYATIGLSAQNSFETMRPYEFAVSSGYAFHVTHQFLSTFFHKKRKNGAQLELCGSAFYADNSPSNIHTGINLNAPINVYYEAGFRLKRLITSNFYSIGFGIFYRLGVNSLPKWNENVALKLTFGFSPELHFFKLKPLSLTHSNVVNFCTHNNS